MQVRPITREEHYQAMCIQSTAFLFVLGEPDPKDNGWKKIRGAFQDDGTMAACIVDWRFLANLNGHMVGMCGIGGVASLPEYRRQGHVRAIMAYILADAYDRGDVYSTLYPFSFVYYRKFGYELASWRYITTIPMTQMAHYKTFGSTTEHKAGEDLAPFKQIYDAFCKRYIYACDRDHAPNGKPLWQGWLPDTYNPRKTKEYAYLWRDTDGTPGAYALVRPTGSGDDSAFDVYDYAFVSPRALRGLLGFLRLLDGQVKNIKISLPEDLPPHALFPEPYDVDCRCEPRGMVRLVNVGKALETLGQGAPDGSIVLGVTDEMLPRNSGSWRLTITEGKAAAEKTQDAPEWPLGIGPLSQLVAGVITPKDADCAAPYPAEKEAWLQQVFPLRPHHLVERF